MRVAIEGIRRSRGRYTCEYEVRGLHLPVRDVGLGVDSLHALTSVLVAIQNLLQVSRVDVRGMPSTLMQIGEAGTRRAMLIERVLARYAAIDPLFEADKTPGNVENRVVAERRYSSREGGNAASIVVRIFMPCKSSSRASCRYAIRGLASPLDRVVAGGDTLEALYAAVAAVGNELRPFRSHLSWGNSSLGDDGLPLVIFPQKKNARMRKLLELLDRREDFALAVQNAERFKQLEPRLYPDDVIEEANSLESLVSQSADIT